MKKNLFKNIILVSLFTWSFSLQAAITTGKITTLRAPTNGQATIYFKMTPPPIGVTEWLYVTSGSGNSTGCQLINGEAILERAYSALLAAKVSSETITVGYCLDSNGYGLVNEFVELD